jgi:RNA 3'-phosphate cyclase
MDFVEVDGSEGEGGGQILRSALSFAAILRRPVRVTKVRAGREVPGLKRQHVSAVKVLAQVFGGDLTGATEGSSTVTFVPGAPRLNSLSLDMGTAASITLVLQAVVPAVALSGHRLSLDLVGGTDVPWSPTLDYYHLVARGAYAAAGISFGLEPKRRGYYPRGGGRVTATIDPCDRVVPMDFTDQKKVSDVFILSRCGNLPRHVADRQLSAASDYVQRSGLGVAGSEVGVEEADSPGSSVLCYAAGHGVFLGGDSIGARGRRAEEVGADAARRFLAAAGPGASMDSNLADMIVPLLSLAEEPSKVRVPFVTDHLKSGLHLASLFTSCSWSVEPSAGAPVVTVNPGAGN